MRFLNQRSMALWHRDHRTRPFDIDWSLVSDGTQLQDELQAAIDNIQNWPIPMAAMPPFIVTEASLIQQNAR